MADSARRRWSDKAAPLHKDKISVAKQLEPMSGYDEYLSLLHQKNKFVQEEKSKPKSKIELERREHGFSVYVNGAHQQPPKTSSKSLDATRSRPKSQSSLPSHKGYARKPKTAAGLVGKSRKNWSPASLHIQSQKGETVHVDAPEDLTGQYDDDFVSDEDESDNEYSMERDLTGESDESQAQQSHESAQGKSALHSSQNKLIMSISDITELRRSLEKASIGVSSDPESEEDSIEEIIMDDPDIGQDTEIVIDFDFPFPSTANQPRSESVPVLGRHGREATQPCTGGSEILMQMGARAPKPSRPLSAVSRVSSSDARAPTEQERLHVLQALKEENSSLCSQSQQKTGHLKDIEQKVSFLDRLQQKVLLKTLKKIEASASPKTSMDKTTDSEHEENVEVMMEILSNYGHAHLVGITEIQAFSDTGQRISLDGQTPTLQGAYLCGEDAAAVFNNRFKTTKEKNMLLLQMDPERNSIPVLRFHVPARVASLKLWNYNRSLNHLNIGVKSIKVFVDGQLTFDGDVDKGCGNQVFDYGVVIPAADPDTPTYSEGQAPEPASEKALKAPHSEPNMPLPSSELAESLSTDKSLFGSESAPVTSSGRQEEMEEDTRCATRLMMTGPDDNLCRPEVTDSADGGVMIYGPKLPASEGLPTKSQSQRSGNPASSSASESNKKIGFLGKKEDQSRSSCDREKTTVTLKSTGRPDWLTKSSAQKDGKESLSWLPPKGTEKGKQEFEVADELEEERWRIKAASSRDSSDTRLAEKPERKPKHTRRPRIGLEDSWSSLSLFDRSQKGRISLDLEGDAVDAYLSAAKPANTSPETQLDVLDEEEEDSSQFVIPELPCGQVLEMQILSTWGDRFYVGLNGIEIFSSNGQPVPVTQISADPPDINILPESSHDPRVITNLLDGTNRTRDDTHMWLAPFTPGQVNKIWLTFKTKCSISMIRLWNYNKSRIHSFRGVKDVLMTLDDKCIFKGEIERACGGVLGGTEIFGDTILFTTDENILEAVSHFDETFDGTALAGGDPDDLDTKFSQRPSTAGEDNSQIRPATTATKAGPTTLAPVVKDGGVCVYTVKELRLEFVDTWGDPHYFGLTGLEVVGADWQAIPISMSMVKASPTDLHSLPGHELDDRTLDKLFNGVNITSDDTHMWLAPYTSGKAHTLSVTFDQSTQVVGLRVWNYNKSPEDTYRGVQHIRVLLDGADVSPDQGYLVRKGMGVCYFDFVQEITFKKALPTVAKQVPKSVGAKAVESDHRDYEYLGMPTGFIFQLHLTSSCGDLYYIGLNGLEFYDESGSLIPLEDNNIAAFPESVNVLDQVSGDPRTPEKLIDGMNSTADGGHMWLAPILPGIVNRVFVIFDAPTTISMIKLWNYGKTPTRGVRDFGLLVDDLLVYNGQLEPVSPASKGIIPTCDMPQRHHTVLFKDSVLPKSEKHTVIRDQQIAVVQYERLMTEGQLSSATMLKPRINRSGDQDIQLTNDTKVVGHTKSKSSQKVDQALRPTTSVLKRTKPR